jgi:hypothetical protein
VDGDGRIDVRILAPPPARKSVEMLSVVGAWWAASDKEKVQFVWDEFDIGIHSEKV